MRRREVLVEKERMRGMRRREVGVGKERRRGNAEKVCRSMQREKERK